MSEKLSCIIIDDDRISIQVLEELVNKTDLLEFVASFTSAPAALQLLQKQEIDLIFLDVEMPEMTGLEFLQSLTKKPEIIITSSKQKYALEAFNSDVTDYLLKPISEYSRFVKAVMKVVDNKAENIESNTDSIFVKVDSLLINLEFTNILWVEAYGDYVKINTPEKTYTVYSKLKVMEERLPDSTFFRVHRSYIVNLTKIENIDHTNLQIGSKIIPISNSYKDALINKINLL